jgi:hypothetical protein
MLVRAYCGCRLRHILLRNSRRAATIAHRSRYSVRVSHVCNFQVFNPSLKLSPCFSRLVVLDCERTLCILAAGIFTKPMPPSWEYFQSSSLAQLERTVTARSNLFDTTCSKNRPCYSEFKWLRRFVTRCYLIPQRESVLLSGLSSWFKQRDASALWLCHCEWVVFGVKPFLFVWIATQ